MAVSPLTKTPSPRSSSLGRINHTGPTSVPAEIANQMRQFVDQENSGELPAAVRRFLESSAERWRPEDLSNGKELVGNLTREVAQSPAPFRLSSCLNELLVIISTFTQSEVRSFLSEFSKDTNIGGFFAAESKLPRAQEDKSTTLQPELFSDSKPLIRENANLDAPENVVQQQDQTESKLTTEHHSTKGKHYEKCTSYIKRLMESRAELMSTERHPLNIEIISILDEFFRGGNFSAPRIDALNGRLCRAYLDFKQGNSGLYTGAVGATSSKETAKFLTYLTKISWNEISNLAEEFFERAPQNKENVQSVLPHLEAETKALDQQPNLSQDQAVRELYELIQQSLFTYDTHPGVAYPTQHVRDAGNNLIALAKLAKLNTNGSVYDWESAVWDSRLTSNSNDIKKLLITAGQEMLKAILNKLQTGEEDFGHVADDHDFSANVQLELILARGH